MEPVGRMDGDSLPVSAFAYGHEDGTFCQGASAYEKRGVAVTVPEWDATKCIQCNQCSYVCPHATIRPYALTEEEAKNAPAAAKIVDIKAGKGKGVYKFAIAISPLDCMGCSVCVEHLPGQGPDDGAPGVPGRAAGRVRLHGGQGCPQGRHGGHQDRQGQPVQAAPAGVLRLLRRLRRDRLCPPGHPGLRRPDVHLQRHRLLLHLGRSRRYLSLHRQQGGQGSRLGQLPVRGQRRARPGPVSWARRPSATVWPTRPAS